VSKEWDCGMVHGRDAGRLTVHASESLSGMTAAVYVLKWHPVRGQPHTISQHLSLTEAKDAGWREYDRRTQREP
jgi:hypothetical protein